ncbi:hypothetical protein WR25_19676 [Diploscapter pachys]|uniref:Acyl-coenzyme A oxidase n=1 Tax=Diploscapter pachys TaxID=2018661 RepID=A0A2A2JVX6_9BILA|nr:hypothetical protein WR25_19676 [Diploscapter pachys]
MTTPLIDEYRKKASFDVNTLRNIIDGEEFVEAKPQEDFAKALAAIDALETFDQGTAARYFLHANVFGSAVRSLGTDRHAEILRQTEQNEIVGCFCLTEVSHGSNTQKMQTTATFDKGEFVFHTPNIGAIKCWAGNLSHSATHAVVFAQLYTEGRCQGLHSFVIQVRDMKTMKPLPGIAIGDMGEKPGDWNGVENGWMRFDHHRAPLWTLLNKGCDVTLEGKYVTSFKSQSEKQSVTLGTLSIGRMGIITKGANACILATTIALRYSVARRQFGPPNKEEMPVFEYPLQQYRLIPYLCGGFVIKIFQKRFQNHFVEYMWRVMSGEKSEELAEMSKEIHALSAAAKPVSTWMGIEALGEARRACGGHGFLTCSRLNDLRESFDPSQTYEGENNMILQQSSNIIFAKVYQILPFKTILEVQMKEPHTRTPMGTMNYLLDTPKKFSGFSNCIVEDVLSAYKYLIRHLIETSMRDYEKLKTTGKDSFTIRNEIQVHRAHTLSIAYGEHAIIQWGLEFVRDIAEQKSKQVMQRVLSLYSLFVLDKHLATLYISGYCSGPEFGDGIRSSLRLTCASLAPDAIGLVDVLAPPDFILGSSLGAEDGRAYDRLMEVFLKHENESPPFQKDLANFLVQRSNNNSKL